MFSYVVSASRETVIDHCVSGPFSAESSIDVICAKGPRIEVRTLNAEENLVLIASHMVFGRVTCLKLFSAPYHVQNKNWLLVLTDRPHFFIFSYDNQRIFERGFGNLGEMLSKPIGIPLAVADCKSRFLLLHLFHGLVSVILFDQKGAIKETFISSLEELNVLDMEIVSQHHRQLLCVLHVDNRDHRHVKTYELNDIKTLREMPTGPWNQPHVDGSAHKMIGCRDGLFLFSANNVVYLELTEGNPIVQCLSKMFGKVEAVGEVDQFRILVCDESGLMHVLATLDNKMTISTLGETSVATKVCYLDAGLVFVASRLGDSQLVRLTEEGGVQVVDTYTNLGPIVHMAMMDLDKKGGQLVTCSGGTKDGSLRVIRNGVGVDEQCSILLPGIQALFGVKANLDDEFDSYLVQSFSTETRVLGFEEETVLSDIAPCNAFALEEPTLYCGNVTNKWILQVTPTSVRFLTSLTESNGLEQYWPISVGKRVTFCTVVDARVLLALTEGCIVVLENQRCVFEKQFEHQVSCAVMFGDYMVVGLWTDLSIRLIQISSQKECFVYSQEDSLSRSMVLVRFSNTLYLFVGLADGRLLSFCVDELRNILVVSKSVSLGMQPINLSLFRDAQRNQYVFCACDRPSIAYSHQDKVLLSNVNLPLACSSSGVSRIASFHTESFPNCLAFASEDQLIIGNVNNVERIHVRSIPLKERPSRLAHQPQTSTFGVCVHGAQQDGEEFEICRLRIVDDRSFKVIDSFRFDDMELPFCILSTNFSLPDKTYYVVGTAFSNEEDSEPSRGRILVFEVCKIDGDSERRLFLVTEKTVKGGVYDVCVLDSGKLVCGVNSKVQVFSWTDRSAQQHHQTPKSHHPQAPQQDLLSQDASYHGNTLCLNLKSFGEYIVVGDLVKSASLLLFDSRKNTIKEISRGLPPNWVTSLAILDEHNFLTADIDGNLIVLSTSEKEESSLVSTGEFCWGDFINVFCLGSLTLVDNDHMLVKPVPKLIFGTANGAIGVLARISEQEFALLNRLQIAIDLVFVGVGNQKYLEYRAFRGANGKTHPARGFIDGDFIEMLLDFDASMVEDVVQKMNQGLPQNPSLNGVTTSEPVKVTVEELLRLVEELARLH